MAAWTVQLITLLGVALGAMASFVSTKMVDRGRWQREERLRWDAKRLECYSEFSAAMMRFINIGYRMAADFGLPALVEPLTGDAGAPALADAEAELSLWWGQLNILGSADVIAAAQSWRQEAWHLELFAHGHSRSPTEFRMSAARRRRARSHFYAMVRADLGVAGGGAPAELGMRLERSLQSEPVDEADNAV